MPVLIVILVLLVLSVAAAIVIPRFFTIEKVEVDDPEEQNLPEEAAEEGEPAENDLDDGMSLKEKMELGGYFDNEEAATEHDENPAEGATEERFGETDRLTELKAGNSYLNECQKALAQAKAQDQVFACARFDYDRFRFINSLKGMITGDFVLTRTSQELEAVFPPGSYITRVSADHFAAFFPVPDTEVYQKISDLLEAMCEKIRADMALKGSLRLRMGVAYTRTAADYDVRILMHKANIARHCIKASRDEAFRLYDDSMLSSYLFGESAMEDYSENQYDEEFVLYCTPIEDISLHVITCCEALTRWVYEDEVDKALPSSMNKNMIPTNSQKVVYQACKALSRWRKAGKQPLPILISLPPTEFFKADIDAFLAKVLAEFQLEPVLLNIVIDAAMARLDWSSVSHQLKRISDVGIKVGVDGIDTGYRDLTFLNEMPVNFIKLHRSFTRGLLDDDMGSENRLLQMVAQARQDNRTVYLEGVDSQELAECVNGLGVRMIQGAFAGRPQKTDAFAEGLTAYMEKKASDGTVILDNAALNQGEFKVY